MVLNTHRNKNYINIPCKIYLIQKQILNTRVLLRFCIIYKLKEKINNFEKSCHA